MAYVTTGEAIKKLAAAIGKNVYIDVEKWHLYLRDAHLYTALGQQFYPLMQDGNLQESQVLDPLKKTPVQLGGGKPELPLLGLLPIDSQMHLKDVLTGYQRQI